MRWMDHSCWHNGHRLFCLTHNDMQQWWNEWLHSPHTTTQSCRPRVSFLHSAWQRRQASEMQQNDWSMIKIEIFNENCDKNKLKSLSPHMLFSIFFMYDDLDSCDYWSYNLSCTRIQSTDWLHAIFFALIVSDVDKKSLHAHKPKENLFYFCFLSSKYEKFSWAEAHVKIYFLKMKTHKHSSGIRVVSRG